MKRTDSWTAILLNCSIPGLLVALGAWVFLLCPSTLHGQTGQGLPPAKPGSAAAPRPLTPPPPAPSAQELAGPPAGAVRLPSGISTLLLRAGTGKVSPRNEDFILFFAVGRQTDGDIVQNTYASPDPTRTQMSKLFPAWREALAGMVVGEQRRFWFPAELAPKNPKTGVQEAVVFDLELVKVISMPAPPAELKSPSPKAQKVGLGTWTLTLKPGKEGAKASRLDAALLNFTVWNDAGQTLSTSVLEGRPTLFPLDRVMTSFADCVAGMTIGEVRRCWIAAERNEGFPGAPSGALIFEIELLNLADAAKVFTPGTAKPN